MKKEIIFVRHAECESNQLETHQAGNQVETDPLTAEGVAQARALAQRFGHIAVEAIISSSYLRARQTAGLIAEATGADVWVPVYEQGRLVDKSQHDTDLVEQAALLRELDVPSELEGLHYRSRQAKDIKDEAEQYLREPDARYSDQENLHDQWKRSADIVEYLKSRPEQLMVVVSHGGLLKYLLGHLAMTGEDELPLQHKVVAADRMAHLMWYHNTGITAVMYEERTGKWQWLPTDIDHLHPKYFSIMPDKKELSKEDTTSEI